MKRGDLLQLHITASVGAGKGLARVDGMVVFVSGAMEGDLCLVQVDRLSRRVAFAHVRQVITPSPHRTAPDCPLFSDCGGCCARSMSYAHELDAKAAHARDCLSRIGGWSAQPELTLGAPSRSGWRNKALMRYDAARGDLGFVQEGTHVPAGGLCNALQDAQSAEAVRRTLLDHCAHTGFAPYGLLLRQSERTPDMLVAILSDGPIPQQEELVSALVRAVPRVSGICLCPTPGDGGVGIGRHPITLYGRCDVREILLGREFSLSPAAFFQVNTRMAERLYAHVASLIPADTACLLDLYCGIGSIGLCCAPQGARLIGAEIVPDAVACAEQNARRFGREAEYLLGDAGKAAAELEARGLSADCVIVDPPRKGLSPELCELLCRMAPRRLIYVSCDPATLARDLTRLPAFRPERYALFDLFPGTSHIETVVLLSRKKPDLRFRSAQQGDTQQVLSLYQSAKNDAFCVWNDNYPSVTEIAQDLETRNLYVLTAGSKIIGAISVVAENELDGFNCWSCKEGKEIARVVIDKGYQGHGLSFEMVQNIESVLRENGCNAIHLSVVKSNIPAYKTYIKAGFIVVGEAQMYGNDYFLMEKTIVANFPPK